MTALQYHSCSAAASDLCEHPLVCQKPLCGELLENVVQDEVHAPDRQRVACAQPAQEVVEQRGPLPGVVKPRYLGEDDCDLDCKLHAGMQTASMAEKECQDMDIDDVMPK
jgi:hypothetical protein